MTHAILFAVLGLFTSLSPAFSSEIHDYCEIFECEISPWSTGDCTEERDIKTCCIGNDCWQLEKLKFCCNFNGSCTLTSALSNCDPDDYLVICEWGMSLADGGFDCFDE